MKTLLVVLAALAAIGLCATAASARKCAPVLAPGEDLTRVAANCPASTTFTIKDGSYKLSGPVLADSGDVFKGVYSDRSRPRIDANGAESAFYAGGTNGVTIRGLSVTGTKGGDWCEPACGSAIKGGEGTNLHLINVRLHHNPNQGIGNPGDGFLLKGSEIDHNGRHSFTLLDTDSGKSTSSAAGIKITGSSATFRNNEIHGNYWNGIWCDRRGGRLIAAGNHIHHNGKTGIQYETCKGPGSKIENNTITRNGHRHWKVRAVAGILLQAPQGVEVANNTLSGNREYGIRVVKTASDRQRTFGVRIHHNSVRSLKGCRIPGVKCQGNRQ